MKHTAPALPWPRRPLPENRLAPHFEPLYWRVSGESPKIRYKVYHGGRNGGKGWAISQALAWFLVNEPGIRIVGIRERHNSIGESSKYAVDRAIKRAGLQDILDSKKYEITGPGGSRMFFRGLNPTSAGAEEAIKSLEDVDIAWVDEAQDISRKGLDLLLPTIRKKGSEIWFSINPTSRTEAVSQDWIIAGSRDDSLVVNTNFTANPWHNEEQENLRKRWKIEHPETYDHIWLGQFAGALPGEYQVLSHDDVMACKNAYDEKYMEGSVHAGYDVADGGQDYCALVLRKGPVVFFCERWPGKTSPVESANLVQSICNENNTEAVWFDKTGVGSGPNALWEENPPPFDTKGVHFGSLAGPDVYYEGNKNRDSFVNRSAQMAGALRKRVNATKELPESNPDDCLFFHPGLPESFLDELTRPRYERQTGKLRIIKRPKGENSPDRYDATALAFAQDSEHGLHSGMLASDMWFEEMEEYTGVTHGN